MKGQLISHMILLGIGAVLIAVLALTFSTVSSDHSEELADLQTGAICNRVKLTAENMWRSSAYVYPEKQVLARLDFRLPPELGGKDYFVKLSGQTIEVNAEEKLPHAL